MARLLCRKSGFRSFIANKVSLCSNGATLSIRKLLLLLRVCIRVVISWKQRVLWSIHLHIHWWSKAGITLMQFHWAIVTVGTWPNTTPRRVSLPMVTVIFKIWIKPLPPWVRAHLPIPVHNKSSFSQLLLLFYFPFLFFPDQPVSSTLFVRTEITRFIVFWSHFTWSHGLRGSVGHFTTLSIHFLVHLYVEIPSSLRCSTF